MSKTRSDIIDLIFDKECKRRGIKIESDYYYEVRDFFHAGWAACEERKDEEVKSEQSQSDNGGRGE